LLCDFFFSSRRRHTRCYRDWSQTCALPIWCRKPDPRIFRHALDGLGVESGDATFVGDSPSRDMAGARGVGMAHIWLVGEATWHPPPCCPGDRVIRSLGELRGLLL